MTQRSDELNEARIILESGSSTPEEIVHAIVTTGKPLDTLVVNKMATLVLTYLDHEDFLVRYQAIWFLGCWGRLPQYLDSLIVAMGRDSELDNRAFAARCAGRVLAKSRQSGAVVLLLDAVRNVHEELEVRRAAYASLLFAWSRPEYRDFEPIGNKPLEEMDTAFIDEIDAWILQQEKTEKDVH